MSSLQGRSLGLSQKLKRLRALCEQEAWDEADKLASILFEQFPKERLVVQSLVEIAQAKDEFPRFSAFLYRLWKMTSHPDVNLAQAYMVNCLEMGCPFLAYYEFLQSTHRGFALEREVVSTFEGLKPLYQKAHKELASWSIPESDREMLLVLNDESVLCIVLGLYQEALALLEKAIALAPHVARYYNNKASATLMLGRLDEAFQQLSLSLEKDPENIHALCLLARLQRIKGAEDEAQALLPRLLASPLQGSAVQYARKLLEGLACLQRHDEIVQYFQRHADDIGDDAFCKYLVGVAYAHKGDEEEAQKLLKEAAKHEDMLHGIRAEKALEMLARPPLHRLPLPYLSLEDWLPRPLRLAGIAHLAGEPEDKEAFFAKHPEFEPLFVLLTHECGEDGFLAAYGWATYFQREDWIETIRAFVTSPKGSDSARLFLFQKMSQEGYFPNGQEILLWREGKQSGLMSMGFKITYEPKPHSLTPQVYKFLHRGVACMNEGDLEEAEAWLRKAYALAPEDASVCGNLSTSLEQQGKVEEAKEIFERLMEAQPDYFFGRCRKAIEAIERGDLEEGDRWLDPLWKQKELHASEVTMFLHTLCTLAVARQRWDVVKTWTDMWEKIDPEDPKLEHWYLRMIQEKKMPRGEEAKPWLRKALKGFLGDQK